MSHTLAYVFPRKPYDEVQSSTIRAEIRSGAFEDIDYRRYVNELVWLEWYTLDFDPASASGVSAFGCNVHRWRLAARLPELYDAIRDELGADTRAAISWPGDGSAQPAKRRRVARRHRAEWHAVAHEDKQENTDRQSLGKNGRRRPFARFRFPIIPYDTVTSSFIREEIAQESFDNLEHRRYVNKLVWIEWFAATDQQLGFPSPVGKNWRLAAQHPQAFDIVRREVGADTRETVRLEGEISYGDIDADAKRREYRRAWRAVQEQS